MAKRELTDTVVAAMSIEERYTAMKKGIDVFLKDYSKSFKGNKSASERTRKALLEIKILATPIRKDILINKKLIPVKKRNK